MTTLRIFLVDDHEVVRTGLALLINTQPDMVVVGEADEAQTVLPQVVALQPGVVLMDVALPGIDGIHATEQLTQHYPTARVLALSAYEETGYIRRILQAGAAGYLLKRVAPQELFHAIRTVAAGGLYLDPTIAGRVVADYVPRPQSPTVTKAVSLSARETDVLRHLALGYTNKEIATRLGISTKTVETHKARLMEKLGLRSRVELVRYAIQQGWLQAE